MKKEEIKKVLKKIFSFNEDKYFTAFKTILHFNKNYIIENNCLLLICIYLFSSFCNNQSVVEEKKGTGNFIEDIIVTTKTNLVAIK